MKNIRYYTSDFSLSGYENIQVKSIDDINLSAFDDGELDEIILDDVIDYLPIDKVEDLIQQIVLKLKKGGTIIISGRDLFEASKAFTNYNLSIIDANKIIFGNNPSFSKKLGFTVFTLSNFLKEVCNVRILKKRVNNFDYAVEAIRE